MAPHRKVSLKVDEHQSAFATEGYIVHRRLLERDEVRHYRALLDGLARNPSEPAAFRREQGGFAHVEGLTHRREFWPIVFHERLLAAARRVLGEDIRYIRHSDLHVNYPLSPRWHGDLEELHNILRHRLAGNSVPFRILRAGLYLGDNMVFGVVAGSHLRSWRLLERQVDVTNRVNRMVGHITRRLVFPPFPGRATWLHLDPGDCVLFDVRLLHTGHYAQPPKYAILLCYGAANAHSMLHDLQFVCRPELINRPMPSAFRQMLIDSDLYLGDQTPHPIARQAPNPPGIVVLSNPHHAR
jgi:phytanoyl-CoA dioxygenase PhyH